MERNTDQTFEKNLEDLKKAWETSPAFSLKIDSYFPVYAKLFSHLRGTKCVFIECGVLGGGSLFMWKKWLGDEARVIGIDLNPEALQWNRYGFEIFIGDQGDPLFWESLFRDLGTFDALLDDGGHQSFQQIVTLNSALKAAKKNCVIAIEDTATSFFRDFKNHGKYTFLSYAKSSTDLLLKKILKSSPGRIKRIQEPTEIEFFNTVNSVEFFSGIVAYHVDKSTPLISNLIMNMNPSEISDFRYIGKKSASVTWPALFVNKKVTVNGGSTFLRTLKRYLTRRKIFLK